MRKLVGRSLPPLCAEVVVIASKAMDTELATRAEALRISAEK